MKLKRILAFFVMCAMLVTSLNLNVTALMSEDQSHYTFSQTEKYWLKDPKTRFNIEYAGGEVTGKEVAVEGTYHGKPFSYFLPILDYMLSFTVSELLDIMSYQYNTEVKAEDEPEIQLTTDDIDFSGISAHNGSYLVSARVIPTKPNITSEYDFSEAERNVLSEKDISILAEYETESKTKTEDCSIVFSAHYDLYTVRAEYRLSVGEGSLEFDVNDIVCDMSNYYNTVLKEPEEPVVNLTPSDVELVQVHGYNGTVIKTVAVNRHNLIGSYASENIPESTDGYLNIGSGNGFEWNGRAGESAVLTCPEGVLTKENDSDYMVIISAELGEPLESKENSVLITLLGRHIKSKGINEINSFDIIPENGRTSYIYAFNAEDLNAADGESWSALLKIGCADEINLTAAYVKIPEDVESNVEFNYSENANGTLTVTGYEGECQKLVIPDEIDGKQVAAIGNGAFSSKLLLREAVLPNGMEMIEGHAFEGCRALKSIDIPDSVLYINDFAFHNCAFLEAIKIPDKVTAIKEDTFRNCASLKSVTVPDSLTSISSRAFYGCTSLTALDLPKNMDYVGGEAFQYCSLLESLVFPDGAVMIGENTFKYCSALKSVVIPNSVTTIDGEAFKYCFSLENVKIPQGLRKIGISAFADCSSLKSVEIPKSVTNISIQAFMDCTSLESVIISVGVESIDDFAFAGCNSLESIDIPESVTTMGMSVFYKCRSLVSVKLPDNGVSIGGSLFQNCTSLVSFEIHKSLTTIPNSMFSGCKSLETIILHDGLTSIESYAFADCTALASIDIPDSVTNIQKNAFESSGLKSVKIPKGVTTIEGNTFYECEQLASVSIPDSVTVIEGDAFRATALVSVEIPDSVTKIGRDAFAECLSLTSAVIPKSVTDIDLNVFALCPYYLTIFGYTGSHAEEYANNNSINFVALDNPGETQIDGETGIVISSEDSENDSLEGKNLEVEKTESTETSLTFNITLTDGKGEETQPEKPVTVSVPLPSEWDGSITFVYRREKNGKYTDMKAVFKDGRLIFTTNHFSEYVVTTEKLVSYTLGDVDANEKITTVDAKWILQYISGSREFTDEEFAAADVNGDGKITTADAKWILQSVSGSRELG